MKSSLATACLAALLALPCFSEERLATTPPMGWNSWNHFQNRVTDADVRAAAEALVSTGMKDAGYTYVVIDDSWQGSRDSQGVLHPDSRFPDMKALADFVHAKGLKFGLYSSPGATTCVKHVGSQGHESQDAKMYADWGVDFLKYDICSLFGEMEQLRQAHPETPDAPQEMMIAAFRKMGLALKATGRPIVYSLSEHGIDDPWKWAPALGANMWRTTADIDTTYGRMVTIGFSQEGLAKYAGPGHWNDPDMLEIGNGDMTEDERKTHMSLWVILAAPLMAGNDLTRMSDSDKRILMNREVIAIDQDPLGAEGSRLYQSGDIDVWTKPLSGGRVAVGMFNRGSRPRQVTVYLGEIGFGHGAQVRDVWQGKDRGSYSSRFTDTVPWHGVSLLILSKSRVDVASTGTPTLH
jgi:alpha-galactosidase